jgi:hypothetical protein
MSNWVEVEVTVTGFKVALDKLMTKLSNPHEKGFCSTFLPIPEAFNGIQTGSITLNGTHYSEWEVKNLGKDIFGKDMLANVPLSNYRCTMLNIFHGTCSWYEWCIKHWGIKWDAEIENLTRKSRSITFKLTCVNGYPERIFEMIRDFNSDHMVHFKLKLGGEWYGNRNRVTI